MLINATLVLLTKFVDETEEKYDRPVVQERISDFYEECP